MAAFEPAQGARKGTQPMALKNVNEVAAYLGISPWTVRKLVRVGKLKAVRIGRRVLLEEEEINRFISACKGD